MVGVGGRYTGHTMALIRETSTQHLAACQIPLLVLIVEPACIGFVSQYELIVCLLWPVLIVGVSIVELLNIDNFVKEIDLVHLRKPFMFKLAGG